jgi:hypothetical protein
MRRDLVTFTPIEVKDFHGYSRWGDNAVSEDLKSSLFYLLSVSLDTGFAVVACCHFQERLVLVRVELHIGTRQDLAVCQPSSLNHNVFGDELLFFIGELHTLK